MVEIPKPVEVPINDLKPYSNNVKVHRKTQIEGIKSSMSAFGFYAPILIDKENNIIAGHGRYEAAKELNMDMVPCIRMDSLDPEQVKALRLIDNRIAESEWDIDALKLELEEMPNFDFHEYHVNFEEFIMPNLSDAVVDIDPSEQHLNSYLHGNLKQVVIVMNNEEFENVMRRIELAGKELGTDTTADTFLALLTWYEEHKE